MIVQLAVRFVWATALALKETAEIAAPIFRTLLVERVKAPRGPPTVELRVIAPVPAVRVRGLAPLRVPPKKRG